ncbi:hypothetical protein [Oceanospirillum sediminis]|uniref:Uncharacterized protein n=1 Tax=Oceanospirillum sediminis TaxID=2760088 RepID=A0A839ISC4_9GAMM|nr:hypothetical protein [Oceanospirillum sediminis]MBB1487878.1 hypothetical protein [Oceanospirillum sediminis]
MASSSIIQKTSLSAYFHEQLIHFGGGLKPQPHEDTLWYLGEMLARLGDSRQLFAYQDGEYGLRPLALLYQDALNSERMWQRCLILRQLGDLSLFMSALFPEVFARKGLGKDYLSGMGGGAYEYLADHDHHAPHIYLELSSAFEEMIALVAQVCSRNTLSDTDNVIAIYQQWQKTKEPGLANKLRVLGIDVDHMGSHH